MKKFVGILCAIFFVFGISNTAWSLPYADSVVSFTPGGSQYGVEIYQSAGSGYVGPSGPGTYDPTAVLGAPDGVSLALGDGGAITLEFAGGGIYDGPGYDLVVYDSFGLEEGFTIDISGDGLTFFTVGTYSGLTVDTVTEAFAFGSSYATYVDIASSAISRVSFIRLTEADRIVWSYPEGYDLDAVRGLHVVPEPASLLLLGSGLLGLVGFGRKKKEEEV